jgi:hypothetical protein
VLHAIAIILLAATAELPVHPYESRNFAAALPESVLARAELVAVVTNHASVKVVRKKRKRTPRHLPPNPCRPETCLRR